MKCFKVLAVPFYIVFYKTYQKCYDICSLNPLQAIDIIEWFFKCLDLENTENFQRTSGYMGEFKWKTFKESVFTKLEHLSNLAVTVKANTFPSINFMSMSYFIASDIAIAWFCLKNTDLFPKTSEKFVFKWRHARNPRICTKEEFI